VHRDADGFDAAGGDRAADEVERAIGADRQDGDLVASRVYGEDVPTVARDLDRTLRSDDRAGTGAASSER